MNILKKILFRLAVLLPLVLAAACRYPAPVPGDGWAATGRDDVDSVAFRTAHHYWRNYNLSVRADSLTLLSQRPGQEDWSEPADSVTVRRGEAVVVADVAYAPADTVDSVWVKVARDQLTQGWVRESRLLRDAEPDDPVSRAINALDDAHACYAATGALLAAVLLLRVLRRKPLRLVYFADVPSFYPTLLCLSVAGGAVLYGSIQYFVPETWVEFYFHPTLNPFGLPPILSLFVATVWLMLVSALAALDDLRHRLDAGEAVVYWAGTGLVCLLLYRLLVLLPPAASYPLFLLYAAFAVLRQRRHGQARYLCGRCGTLLTRKGACPRCGACND